MVMKQCCGYLLFAFGEAVVSNLHGTSIIMNLAQNVLSVLSKCVCVCVCVWNFSREVKLVPELPWHYFGSISTYSVELLSHLVFCMSIWFFCSCACWKRISILQYNPSRGMLGFIVVSIQRRHHNVPVI